MSKKRLIVTTTESYVFDQEKVEAAYDRLNPDPNMFGDGAVYATFAYLTDSYYGADLFENQGDRDSGYEVEEIEDDS